MASNSLKRKLGSTIEDTYEEEVVNWLKTLPEFNYWANDSITRAYIVDNNLNAKSKSRILGGFVAYVQECLNSNTGEPPSILESCFLESDGSLKAIRSDLHEVYLEGSRSLTHLLLMSCDSTPKSQLALQASTDMDPKEQLKILKAGFNIQYQGQALDRLLQHVQICEEMYDDQAHYGHTIALIQASGSGKSRIAKELSTKEYLISVCFRRSKRPQIGWPPGDTELVQFFHEKRRQTYLGEELAAAFLGALAAVIADHVSTSVANRKATPDSKKRKISAESRTREDKDTNPFSMWSYDDGPVRDELMAMVVTHANNLLRDNYEWLEEHRAWIDALEHENVHPTVSEDAAKSDAATSIAPTTHDQPTVATEPPISDISPSTSTTSNISAATANAEYTYSTIWHGQLFQHFAQSEFVRLGHVVESLANAQDTNQQKDHLRFFFAFDECAELGDADLENLGPKTSMSLIALLRMLKAADNLKTRVKFWFLLLDTSSEAFLLAPSGPNAASARLRGSFEVLPPFLHLGLNQMAVGINIDMAGEVLDIEFLRKWGRPYWSTIKSEKVLEFAREKLFHKHLGICSFDYTNDNHVFAAFAYRVALDIGDSPAASRMAVEAVSRHMRIIRSIVGDKMETMAPSEPILSIAAACALNRKPTAYKGAMKRLLDHLILKDLILDRGSQGELCNRLLFIMARDRAAITRTPEQGFVNINKTRVTPITLADFLETLLGADYGCQSAVSAGNINGLRQWSRSRWVNWTHYVILTERIDEIPIRTLELAFFTGSIFQCHHDQAVIDWFAPVYNGPLDQKYDRRCLGAIGGQTKARGRTASKDLGLGLTMPPIVYTNDNGGDERQKPPTLVMLMDLATDESFLAGGKVELTRRAAISPFSKSLTDAKRKKVWKGYADVAAGDEPEPTNFFLNIRGRNVEQYPVLKELGVEASVETLFQKYLSHPLSASLREVERNTLKEIYHHELLT